jgi:hypothetical protein
MSEEIEGPLLRFKQPSAEDYAALEQILRSLKASAFVETRQRKVRDATVDGTLAQIVDRLKAILARDYEDNMVEERAGVCSFDYLLLENDAYRDGVEILTRLYKEGRDGNIMFGRLVKRVDDNRYLLWSDD